MYLEKLEIQGFKSFANKNVLVFPGMLNENRRGITAIVGPNGSGKSNVADAVRWALGEQSMKTLRGKKGEDIIFSGSDKKGRLGMSEASLFLNNEDHQAPIDYSQVVITRRLYRDGDSEYLINNGRVRLSDVQILLAKSNFGQKTYSVIGQGMVESFLNTSLAEKKEFFDEATGVKQFQIKRDESLNKLANSYENLHQADMLLFEIEPRLKSLTRQVNKLKRRDEIEAELKELQLNYYGKLWHEINKKFNEFNEKFLGLEKIKLEKEKKIENLNRELDQIREQKEKTNKYSEWQQQLNELQNQKDVITKQLVKMEAELEIKLEAKGQFDLSWLNNKKAEIKKELTAIGEEVEMLEKNIEYEKNKLEELKKEKNDLNEEINKINNNLIKQSSGLGDEEAGEINQGLIKLVNRLEQADKEMDLIKIKETMNRIKEEVKRLIKLSEAQKRKIDLEKIHQRLTELTRSKEEISTKINESSFRVSARSERVKLIKEVKEKLKIELADIRNKLKKNEQAFISRENIGEKESLLKNQSELEAEIKKIKEKISSYAAQEETNRERMFALQKNLQNLQNEINGLSEQLNELKVNSTRYETRLEDLEKEIRNNFGNLNKIRQHNVSGDVDEEAVLEKINFLKRQIEQIGGIDPEVEKEYIETKERFDFLSGQVNDLTEAIGSLEKIIKELDLTIKERFDKEFKKISTKFEEYFKILFSGGQAKIIKVSADEEEEKTTGEEQGEPAQHFNIKREGQGITNIKKIKFLQKHNATGLAGIEIQAIPPGKKIKTITMLSGGERALTAIALICAIISCNPSPFVVLDEVDASLDEANSERLAKILDDLSHKTQFIIITHNRATMRKANILYGVTMQDDGTSKLLSIKLDQADKTAASYKKAK